MDEETSLYKSDAGFGGRLDDGTLVEDKPETPCGRIGWCLKMTCKCILALPVLPTFCTVVSLVSSTIAASSDHRLENTLSEYGLDSKWLSGYLYAFLAATIFLNIAIVACAQYAYSYQLLRQHRLDHDDPGACGCCFNCLDSLGSAVICVGYLTFAIAYIVALSMVVLGAMTCVLGAIIEVFHLLCEHTPPFVVYAALKGLEELPLGLNFRLNSEHDVDAFCEAVNSRTPQIKDAMIYTGIFAASQITLSICSWNTLLLLRFRKFVVEHSSQLEGPSQVMEM